MWHRKKYNKYNTNTKLWSKVHFKKDFWLKEPFQSIGHTHTTHDIFSWSDPGPDPSNDKIYHSSVVRKKSLNDTTF